MWGEQKRLRNLKKECSALAAELLAWDKANPHSPPEPGKIPIGEDRERLASLDAMFGDRLRSIAHEASERGLMSLAKARQEIILKPLSGKHLPQVADSLRELATKF